MINIRSLSCICSIYLQIIEERNWVIVAGRNWKYDLVGKTKNTYGTYVRKEQPLRVTDQVQLVDPSDK